MTSEKHILIKNQKIYTVINQLERHVKKYLTKMITRKSFLKEKTKYNVSTNMFLNKISATV